MEKKRNYLENIDILRNIDFEIKEKRYLMERIVKNYRWSLTFSIDRSIMEWENFQSTRKKNTLRVYKDINRFHNWLNFKV